MTHRASRYPLRYLTQKLAASLEEVAMQLQSSATSSFTEALAKGMETFQRQLTAVGVITGAAMIPTLNNFSQSPSEINSPRDEPSEKFLMRLIPRPSGNRTIFSGDVIAFHSPLDQQHIMVRRIAALEGHEMVSDDPDDETFTIPKDHCWVLADNEDLDPPHVIDSRTFGPLPVTTILGRVMYAASSETNHGPIENSTAGMAADAPVLEAELDIETMLAGADDDDDDDKSKDGFSS